MNFHCNTSLLKTILNNSNNFYCKLPKLTADDFSSLNRQIFQTDWIPIKNIFWNERVFFKNQEEKKIRILEKSLIKKQLNLTQLKMNISLIKNQFQSLREQYSLQLKHCEHLEKKLRRSVKNETTMQNLKKISTLCHRLKEKTISLKKSLNNQKKLTVKSRSEYLDLLAKNKHRILEIKDLQASLSSLRKKLPREREASYKTYFKLVKSLKFKSLGYHKVLINKLMNQASKIQMHYNKNLEEKNAVISVLQKKLRSLKEDFDQISHEKNFLFQSYIQSQEPKNIESQIVSFYQLSQILKKGSEEEKAKAIVMFLHIEDERVSHLLQKFLSKTTTPWLKQLTKEILNKIQMNRGGHLIAQLS